MRKKITKTAIKSALESDRALMSITRDWDQDNEARLIYAVRYKSGINWEQSNTKKAMLDQLFAVLAGKEYDELPEIPY